MDDYELSEADKKVAENLMAYYRANAEDPRLHETLKGLYFDPIETEQDLKEWAEHMAEETYCKPSFGEDPVDLGLFNLLPNLGSLWLDSDHPLDLQDMADVPNLEGISINCKLEVLPFLGNTVKDICIYSAPGVDLSDLPKHENLKSLELQESPVLHYDFLASLKNLDELSIDGGEIETLEQLSCSDKITKLSLQQHRITSLAEIERFTELTYLAIPGNLITDLSPLKSLKKLKTLSVSYNPIADYSVLAECTGLEYLDVRGIRLRDIDFVAGMRNLKELHLTDNNVSDLQPVVGLSNLESLIFRRNSVLSLEPISGLGSLETVDAAFNEIDSFCQLPPNLRELKLRNNLFTSLESIKNTTVLPQYGLELAHNMISDLAPLQGRTQLGTLDIAHNRVRSLEPLAGLVDLHSLKANHNMIDDISPLSGLKAITSLDLKSNRIHDFTPLNSLPELNENYIKIDDNPVGRNIRKSARTAPMDSKCEALQEWCKKDTYDTEVLFTFDFHSWQEDQED